MFSLADLECPIVQAPMAGGPSTVALAAAVSGAGGMGFLAAGYRQAHEVRQEMDALRRETPRPFGVNVFAGPGGPADPRVVERYAATLRHEGELGEPRHHDDEYAAKVALFVEMAVPAVSFTFGCPSSEDVERLHSAGCAVWVTVTTPAEARLAAAAGADGLVVQGIEAGGHRGSFDDSSPGEIGLLALLTLIGAETDLPLVGGGGVMTGAGIAAVLACGAQAATLGTAFLLCPEAGTSSAHRDAVRSEAPTALTRAFSGRLARGIVNRFMHEHDDLAPSAYPEVHHLTAPLRAAARAAGDADRINLWAGQGHSLARGLPAAELVHVLATETQSVV